MTLSNQNENISNNNLFVRFHDEDEIDESCLNPVEEIEDAFPFKQPSLSLPNTVKPHHQHSLTNPLFINPVNPRYISPVSHVKFPSPILSPSSSQYLSPKNITHPTFVNSVSPHTFNAEVNENGRTVRSPQNIRSSLLHSSIEYDHKLVSSTSIKFLERKNKTQALEDMRKTWEGERAVLLNHIHKLEDQNATLDKKLTELESDENKSNNGEEGDSYLKEDDLEENYISKSEKEENDIDNMNSEKEEVVNNKKKSDKTQDIKSGKVSNRGGNNAKNKKKGTDLMCGSAVVKSGIGRYPHAEKKFIGDLYVHMSSCEIFDGPEDIGIYCVVRFDGVEKRTKPIKGKKKLEWEKDYSWEVHPLAREKAMYIELWEKREDEGKDNMFGNVKLTIKRFADTDAGDGIAVDIYSADDDDDDHVVAEVSLDLVYRTGLLGWVDISKNK